MGKAEVEAVVSSIEDIDLKMNELQQEKLSLTSEYQEELLEHDLRTVKKVEHILRNLLTEKASECLLSYDVIDVISEVISDIEEEVKQIKK
ncbi:MAG: hypothetical protein IKG36_00935 [Mycoplasmataceae bacterium]|nr:hypothetical protein [Mycoplasmataceae bacterium]